MKHFKSVFCCKQLHKNNLIHKIVLVFFNATLKQQVLPVKTCVKYENIIPHIAICLIYGGLQSKI